MTDLNEYTSQIIAYKAGVIGLWLVLLFAAERLYPKAARPFAGLKDWQRLGRNVVSFAILAAISPLIIVPITVFAADHTFIWRPIEWSGWQGLLLDLLILDLFIYWWHRLNHILPILWRFHVIHHLDEFLDTTTAVRFHFGEVILSALVRAGFIILIGMPLVSVLVFEGMVLISSIFQHSNIKIADRLDRLLSYVIVTPGWHWMHHHAKRIDTDSNYANTLTIWDRLFASQCQNSRDLGMKIGVEKQAEETLIHLISRPFRRG